MAIQSNFVSVLPTVLIDPVLKLRLEQGRWTPESSARGGSIDIDLAYDPQIHRDQLTMPIPEKRRKLLEMLGPIGRDWTVFESNQSKRIAQIFLDIHSGDVDVRLQLPRSTRSTPTIQGEAKLLAREVGDELGNNPYEVLLYMFQSTILMGDWAETYAMPWGKSSISFYTNAEVAEELTAHTGLRFERTGDGSQELHRGRCSQ